MSPDLKEFIVYLKEDFLQKDNQENEARVDDRVRTWASSLFENYELRNQSTAIANNNMIEESDNFFCPDLNMDVSAF